MALSFVRCTFGVFLERGRRWYDSAKARVPCVQNMHGQRRETSQLVALCQFLKYQENSVNLLLQSHHLADWNEFIV